MGEPHELHIDIEKTRRIAKLIYHDLVEFCENASQNDTQFIIDVDGATILLEIDAEKICLRIKASDLLARLGAEMLVEAALSKYHHSCELVWLDVEIAVACPLVFSPTQ